MKKVSNRENMAQGAGLKEGGSMECVQEPYDGVVAKFWDANDFDEYDEYKRWKQRQNEARNRRYRIMD